MGKQDIIYFSSPPQTELTPLVPPTRTLSAPSGCLLDSLNPFGIQRGDDAAWPAPPAPPAPQLPQRPSAGTLGAARAVLGLLKRDAFVMAHWELLELKQEKKAMADTIAALEAQVQQHDRGGEPTCAGREGRAAEDYRER